MNEKLIDLYLLNLLSPEEKASFEQRLEKDESLKKEFLIQKEAIDNIEGFGRMELKSKLKKIHDKEFKNENGGSSNIRFLISRLAVAVAFIGLISLGWLWFQQSPSTSKLYADNFEAYELSLNQRSGIDDIYNQIETLYANGEFQKVIPLFEETLKKDNNRSSQLLLGLGISNMQTDNPENAIPYFEEILAKKDFNFEDESNWYLGLTYLKINDFSNAKKHFEILASKKEKDHHEQSKYILSKLD